MVRSQVRRGRPGRRLQSLGNPRTDVYRALDMSCESPIRATCPKKRGRLVWMSGSNFFTVCYNNLFVHGVITVF